MLCGGEVFVEDVGYCGKVVIECGLGGLGGWCCYLVLVGVFDWVDVGGVYCNVFS